MSNPKILLQWEKLTPIGWNHEGEGTPTPVYNERDTQRKYGRELIKYTLAQIDLPEGPYGQEDQWNDDERSE